MPISFHGIIFGTHMEALDMMGVEFSLPFPPYTSAIVKNLAFWAPFLNFQPLSRYVNVPGLFGQTNIANILSWHYLWDPYVGFGHDGSRIQPVIPSLSLGGPAQYFRTFERSSTAKISRLALLTADFLPPIKHLPTLNPSQIMCILHP